MADPVTMGLIFTAVGTGVSVYSTIQQGRAAEAQSRTEQDILNRNARQKLKEAADIRAAAQEEADKFQREAKRFKGTQRVAIARGGVLVSGTPAFLLEETAKELEADRLEILRQGYLQSEYATSEAAGMRFAGTAARARGKNIRRGAELSSAGTLFRGLGDVGLAKYELDEYKDYRLAKKHGII